MLESTPVELTESLRNRIKQLSLFTDISEDRLIRALLSHGLERFEFVIHKRLEAPVLKSERLSELHQWVDGY